MRSSASLLLAVLALASLSIATIAGEPSAAASQQGSQAAPPPAPAQPQPPPASPQDQDQQQPGYAISVTVPVVNVDATVTDDDGNFLPGLEKGNFRVLEDNKPQVITNFSTGTAPITIVILVEYSRLGYGTYIYNALNWADNFLRQLKPTDYVALESFAMRTNVEVDFTHDPKEVEQGLISLSIPSFSESNVFDAVVETLDRIRDVQGRKAILLLASGNDTFSKLTLDKTLARLKESDTEIYCVGVAQQVGMMVQTNGGADMTFLQAQNQLRTFAAMTGGRAWFPVFDGEIPGIMSDLATTLRNQYSLAYTPTNSKMDGTYRKIKVEVVAPDGGPLTVLDPKGKKHKSVVYARQGYTAPKNDISN